MRVRVGRSAYAGNSWVLFLQFENLAFGGIQNLVVRRRSGSPANLELRTSSYVVSEPSEVHLGRRYSVDNAISAAISTPSGQRAAISTVCVAPRDSKRGRGEDEKECYCRDDRGFACIPRV